MVSEFNDTAMSSYAIYRLPYQHECTCVSQRGGSPRELLSCAELSDKKGFVVAPFMPSSATPVVVICPDVVEHFDVRPCSPPCRHEVRNADAHLKEKYLIDFANFHAQLESGEFRKIVLSRCSKMESAEALQPEDLFMRACQLYPRMFVALVSTPQTGTWLMATPEILLDGDGTTWHTMALAGTMKLTGEQLCFDDPIGNPVGMPSWSDKNIQEQRYVASYITECLEQFTDDFGEEGPRTARAADLVHLRSDFTFRFQDTRHIGDVLQVLHPTPAVCGIPKNKARDFILHNELTPRSYYSGFAGPFFPDSHTHLYVSLRCMQIKGREYDLYAGGGLLRESTADSEWEETEAKLATMRNVLKG
jgi:isochorismate synthase